MAHANHGEILLGAMHPSRRMEKISRPQKKVELEHEVAKLHKMLDHEQRVHEILENASRGHVLSSIPGFLPPKMKELLAELAMVEEEIARLEQEINTLQYNLSQEQQKVPDAFKSKQWNPNASLSFLEPLGRSLTPPRPTIKPKSTHERAPSEARALFFINQAIKGDYTSTGFARSDEKMENFREVGFEERISRKSGVIEKPSMYKLPPRHPTAKVSARFSSQLVWMERIAQ